MDTFNTNSETIWGNVRIVNGEVVTTGRVAFIVVRVCGSYRRVYRREIPDGNHYKPGDSIALYVCDEKDYGVKILSVSQAS